MKKVISVILGIVFSLVLAMPASARPELVSESGFFSAQESTGPVYTTLPDQVCFNVSLAYNGAPSYFPAVTVYDGGSLNGTYSGWCIDTDLHMPRLTPVCNANVITDIYSVLPAGLIEFPDNFDLVQWLLNQGYVGKQSTCNGTYTYGDVQRAIWALIDNVNSVTPILRAWDQCRVNEILAAAAANGEGYEPGCGENMWIVLSAETIQPLIIPIIKECEPEPECGECQGGVTSLTLQYNGTETVDVKVITKDGGVELFHDTEVIPGETFAVTNSADPDGRLGSEISIYQNSREHVRIDTSCSQLIGVSMIFGNFQIVAGESLEGGPLCEVTAPPQPPLPECGECLGGVTTLTLQYNGTETVDVKVITKDGGVELFHDTEVIPGETFAVTNSADPDGRLGSEISIYQNSREHVRIDTSCSQLIGVSMIFGNFQIVAGESLEGGPLCEVTAPPQPPLPECGECLGGVTSLTLQYNGTATVDVKVLKKTGKDSVVIYHDNEVVPGETFTVTNSVDAGGTLSPEIIIVIGCKEYVRIHTSCSQPIGVGMIFGKFQIIAGESKDGGPLCEVTVPPQPECGECQGGVTSLTLQYNGAATVDVKVKLKKGKDSNVIFHDAEVVPGETFTITNSGDRHGKFVPEISIWVNGKEYTRIHTSCSQPIGVGMIFGDFQITAGESLDGGPLCEVIVPPQPPQPECGECQGGVTSLTIQYNGAATVEVKVTKKTGRDSIVLYRDAEVVPGETFTVTNSADRFGKMVPEISIYVNGREYTRIHTSCSQPIGVGMIFGDFQITAGESLGGGPLCEVTVPPQPPQPPQPECKECQGGVTSLTLQYNGTATVEVKVKLKKGKDSDVIFRDAEVVPGETFTITNSGDKHGKFVPEISIYVNGKEYTRIHTSCSQPIGVGMIFGNFQITAGKSLDGGPLCEVTVP